MTWLLWLVLMLLIALIPGIQLFYERYKLALMSDSRDGKTESETVTEYAVSVQGWNSGPQHE